MSRATSAPSFPDSEAVPENNFSSAALRLAGLTGMLLGWRPHEFWGATPAELATVLAALAGPEEACASARDLARLMEMFPDG